jgi:isocitrate dehydrogenase kinase/phosphatase
VVAAEPAPDVRGLAATILEGFDKHYRLFRAISAEAKMRFERGDWAAVQQASVERIEMYDRRVEEGVRRVLERYPEAANASFWPDVKLAFILKLVAHQQPELAQTYFNSVVSRVLHSAYYNNQNLFERSVISTEHIASTQKTWRSYYPATQELRPMLRELLADLELANPWEDLERDVTAVIHAMLAFLPRPVEVHANVQVQVLSSLCYRNQAAYLVGMIVNGQDRTPFAVPIRHNARHELYLDALLLHRMELGAIFSLARAYFMVDMEVPAAFVTFLKWIFPDKSTAELYTALGLQKQGKALFYRDMVEHLRHSSDRFVAAPGVPGMVMVVFTLPSFPYVFKIIRDRF